LLQSGFACRESRGGACCSHFAGHLLRFLGEDQFHGLGDFVVRPTGRKKAEEGGGSKEKSGI
jgi:hypothetical protein